MIRFLTAGESHGKAITTIAEGFPAAIQLTENHINAELSRRKDSVGRGGRVDIESDKAEILSGVRDGKTLGGPIAVLVENKDWKKNISEITTPRPGHADLPGMMKYGFSDARNVLERASARETIARVVVGAIARRMLEAFDIHITSYVSQIGNVKCLEKDYKYDDLKDIDPLTRCPDKEASLKIYEEVEKARKEGDSLGGVFKVLAYNVPPGLGSHVHWDRRLDGQFAMALMSIPAIKSVEVGAGKNVADLMGSQVMDEIFYEDKKGYYRNTNNMGGIEGGMSNGETITLTSAMKPIPTIKKALKTVNTKTLKQETAHYERSDVCAVPRAAIIAESMTAIVLSNAMTEKFGGDTLNEMLAAYKRYIKSIKWSRLVESKVDESKVGT